MEGRVRSLSLAFLLVVTLVLRNLPASSAEAASCQFVLGFKTLHDMIPQIVGDCLENEHHDSVNGDGLQQTTGINNAIGLLVWRKSDNWTAYTDGYRTWINGPFGLQQRLNSQRYYWEQNPLNYPIVPPPVAGERCHTAGLSIQVDGSDRGAGQFYQTFTFVNNLNVPCTFFGYVGEQLLDAGFNPLPTDPHRSESPATITVPPGGTTNFTLHWSPLEMPPATCSNASEIAITPPDEFDSIIVPYSAQVCQNGYIEVRPVGVF
jgi:hypothetical protein